MMPMQQKPRLKLKIWAENASSSREILMIMISVKRQHRK
jgi:hypothetical protein